MSAIITENLRIMNIAKCSDDTLDMFKQTPIYDILLMRRFVCRHLAYTTQDLEFNSARNILRLLEEELKQFFSLEVKSDGKTN